MIEDMASQPQIHAYEFVGDYDCDSNPAYGVVESPNQAPPESGNRADPVNPTAEADVAKVLKFNSYHGLQLV